MGLPRSTYYDAPVATADEAEIVARIEAICEEFEAYGYRRVGAALRHQGIIVNSKKVRRLMREHDLQPRRRKRFVATTDSDHDGPIFPNLAKDVTADGPNQLWVADITYVAIAVGFVYVAVILDAWSRRVVAYPRARGDRAGPSQPKSQGQGRRPGCDLRGRGGAHKTPGPGGQRPRSGTVEALRVLRTTRKTAIKCRRAALQQLHNTIVAAPEEVRDQVRNLTRVARCSGAVVTDHAARKARQDRREDRPPRSLHRLPDGRGRYPS